MVISNIEIMGLESSMIAAGYPVRTETGPRELKDNDYKRAFRLTEKSRKNPAEGQWLTGVVVNFDLTFSNKAWVEAERYRFLNFVSSQSTMHAILKFDIKKQCNSYVDERIINVVEDLKRQYNENPTKENYLALLYNIPAGFCLTARMTTTYRCLLNMYLQRHDHRLPEWRQFCEQLLELPLFRELISLYLGEDDE